MRSACVVLMVVVGCTGTSADDTSSNQMVVEMYDDRFAPPELQVEAGTEIVFRSEGQNPHNAVADDGSWSTEASFGSLSQFEGDEATVRFEEPGRYSFFCTFHGTAQGDGMAGAVIVVESGA